MTLIDIKTIIHFNLKKINHQYYLIFYFIYYDLLLVSLHLNFLILA